MPVSFTRFCERALDLHLTPAQRVLARCSFDLWQPYQLPEADKAIALEIYGGAERIPTSARRTLVHRMGRISGKSLLSAARGLHRMLTADLSLAGPGYPPAVIVIAPVRELAAVTLQAALELVRGSPYLEPLLEAESATRFVLRRPDGRAVTFASVAKSAGGKTARGFWIISALLDESEFIAPSDPFHSVRDADLLGAIRPRLLPGAEIILTSTPWPAESETSRLFDKNWGNPTDALVARAPTLTMRQGDPRFDEVWAIVAAERASDPNNASREFDCIPGDVHGMFFESSTIDKAVSYAPVTRRGTLVSGGIDLAFRNDSSALVVIERFEGKLYVVHMELESPKGAPLVPSTILSKFMAKARELQCFDLRADSHYYETAREHAGGFGLGLSPGPQGGPAREQAFLWMRDLFREGRLVIPNDPRLSNQLKSVLAQPAAGGKLTIVLPRMSGAGHADLVAALMNAVYADHSKYGPLKAEPQKMLPQTIKRRIFGGGGVWR